MPAAPAAKRARQRANRNPPHLPHPSTSIPVPEPADFEANPNVVTPFTPESYTPPRMAAMLYGEYLEVLGKEVDKINMSSPVIATAFRNGLRAGVTLGEKNFEEKYTRLEQRVKIFVDEHRARVESLQDAIANASAPAASRLAVVLPTQSTTTQPVPSSQPVSANATTQTETLPEPPAHLAHNLSTLPDHLSTCEEAFEQGQKKVMQVCLGLVETLKTKAARSFEDGRAAGLLEEAKRRDIETAQAPPMPEVAGPTDEEVDTPSDFLSLRPTREFSMQTDYNPEALPSRSEDAPTTTPSPMSSPTPTHPSVDEPTCEDISFDYLDLPSSFDWANDIAVDKPKPELYQPQPRTPDQLPSTRPRDISMLSSIKSNPWGGLHRRNKRSHHHHRLRPSYTSSLPRIQRDDIMRSPRDQSQHQARRTTGPPTSLDWDRDPRLYALGRALDDLGWTRGSA